MSSFESRRRAAVFGGGTSGLLMGLRLLLAGYEVTIYAKKIRPTNAYSSEIPTDFALASGIPHSVFTNQPGLNADLIAKGGQTVLGTLQSDNLLGITRRRHYELSEIPFKEPKSYAPDIEGFQLLHEDGRGERGVPKRRGVDHIFGWRFNCLFIDMPEYRMGLIDLFEKCGGVVVEGKEYSRSEALSLNGDFIVNAAGLNGNILSDKFKPQPIRGHIVVARPPAGARFAYYPVSYNYTSTIYTNENGELCDVYGYQRLRDLGLGGSRQTGLVTQEGIWKGQRTVGSETEVQNAAGDGFVNVPTPMLELNEQLILDSTGVNLSGWRKYAIVGQRTGAIDGMQLGRAEFGSREIYDILGLGGAGVINGGGAVTYVMDQIARQYHIDLEAPPRIPHSVDADTERALIAFNTAFSRAHNTMKLG